jgi:hypothetical protein
MAPANHLAERVRKHEWRNHGRQQKQCKDWNGGSDETTRSRLCTPGNRRSDGNTISIGQLASSLNLPQTSSNHLGHDEKIFWTLISVTMRHLTEQGSQWLWKT